MSDIKEQAVALLRQRDIKVEFLTHKIITPKGHVRHLFRGREKDKTVRYLGTVVDEELTDLTTITSGERRYIGRTGRIDLLDRAKRLQGRQKRRVAQPDRRKRPNK